MTPSYSQFLDMALMVGGDAWSARDWDKAIAAYDLALSIDRENAEALNRRGRLELIRGNPQQAADFFWQAFVAKPEAGSAVNLALALTRLGAYERAHSWCAEAERIDPAFIPAYVQQAAILEQQGQFLEAEAPIVRGLAVEPGNPDLLWFHSTYQLRRGDFTDGWYNHEQRPPRRDIAAKMDEYAEWKGEPLYGKKLLVIGEQGAGDQIMWSRYLRVLACSGADITLFTRPELARLFAEAFPNVSVATTNDELQGLEPDYWIATGSLAFHHADIFTNKTGICPCYRLANPAKSDSFTRERIAAALTVNRKMRVGLCWRGNPQHPRDAQRSLTFKSLLPLLAVKGVEFVSLQFGERESGLANLAGHDFADTAEAMRGLDLVITVDTATAHLAGSLGAPVWILLQGFSDWRWGLEGERSEWYPTATLIRNESMEMVALRLMSLRASYSLSLIDAAIVAEALGMDTPAAAAPAPAEPARIATRECRYGRMSYWVNDHYIGRAIDLYGEYSQSEADLLRRVLKPRDVVIEAGANIGGLTVAIANIVGPNGQVIAYEPQPAYYALLERNTGAESCRHVVTRRAALGNSTEPLTLRAAATVGVHAPGWELDGEEFTVPQERVDDAGGRWPALIKIDVDGAEMDILRGAEGTINACRPLIYIEHDRPTHYAEMIPWLDAHGYRIYKHEARLYNPFNYAGNAVNVFGSIVSLMLLCVPKERKDLRPSDWGLPRVTVG